jgi:hypothetical protein
MVEMDDREDAFLSQLGRTIQAWLWVEGELYSLYAVLMKGANGHLVSVTFNNIQSVDAKLSLLNACFSLVLPSGKAELADWRALFKRAEKLKRKRNKIVHEPMVISFSGGSRSMSIQPSSMNALALVRGQTTHKGAVVNAEYKPGNAKLLENHAIDVRGLYSLERSFKNFAHELHEFRERIQPVVSDALAAAKSRPPR